MIRINAMGDACPLPVVKTLRALQSLGGAGRSGRRNTGR